MTVSHIANLDPDSAICFLGPADLHESKPMRLMQHYTNLISNIAITVIRALNYIFRDQIWYNNLKARDLVINYINTYDRVDYNDEVHLKVLDIFEELKHRQWGWFSAISYADGLAEMANQKGIQLEIQSDYDEDMQRLNFGKLQDRESYVLNNGRFYRGKTGNLSMIEQKEMIDQTNQQLRALGSELFPIEVSLKDSEANFRNKIFDLRQLIPNHNQPDAIDRFKLESLEILNCQRSNIEDGSKKSDPTVPLADFEFHPEYAQIKDPHKLFEKAIRKVMRSISSTQRNDEIIKMALADLLMNAYIDLEDCHHRVYLNPFNWVCYQKPIVTISLDGNLSARYEPDLLSTPVIGSDPEVAARILKGMKTSNDGYLSPATSPVLDKLLNDMVTVFNQRHRQSVVNLLHSNPNGCVSESNQNCSSQRDLSLYEKPIKEFLKNAKTAYEVFEKAIDYAAQKYANLALIAQDDVIGDVSDHVNVLICKSAIFEMLVNAEVVDDFTLKLNDHVRISFANFFTMVESKDDPLILECKELPDYNLMCESEANADPIYLTSLLSQIKGNSRNVDFLREYLFAEDEVWLYGLKKASLIDSSKKLKSDFEGDADFVKRPLNIKLAISRLSRDSKLVALEIAKNLAKVGLSFYNHFFKSKQMSEEIYKNVSFKEDVLPSIVSFDTSSIYNVVEKVDKPVDMLYVSGLFFGNEDRITIKSKQMPRCVSSHLKLTQTAVNSMSAQNALEYQNNSIYNPSRCGNCGYGALALEIWEGIANEGNIERFNTGLRQVVARYLQANAKYMAPKYLKIGERFSKQLEPELIKRVETYAREVLSSPPLWISDIEIEILSQVFGVRIDVFDYSQNTSLRVADKGSFEGTIMPNRVYGAQFTGAPIRLKFTGAHFQPIRLK